LRSSAWPARGDHAAGGRDLAVPEGRRHLGITQPVAWGFAIINFVWWIGIGHAGTLISAILLLFKQGWRNSINRFAEAMTILPWSAPACSR
jgi:Ni/Fe-hydrogenase subunit HybB-like protein